ncbi:hypothetical protein Franean1_2612 [Parafrankia sp. EAN1pec]|uniref:SpvB/TcaC N-terminal domain-containing protein n=1 Tax=Parafrankia sp. (strain EAN1pec) TaxID=298653 RepID=UPI0000542090|nr:hypothetical protein Franean1_2612 [Frankia sp. EAN1pec]
MTADGTSLLLGCKVWTQADWLFEVVVDYGDHDAETPTPAPDRPWPCRDDPFSSYRSGFEVRIYRLCRRVLMFHRSQARSAWGTTAWFGRPSSPTRRGRRSGRS